MTPHNLHIFNLVDPASSHMFVSVCFHPQHLSHSCCVLDHSSDTPSHVTVDRRETGKFYPKVPTAMVECHLKNDRDYINSVLKSYQGNSLDMCCRRGESGKETSWSQTLRSWNKWTHLNSTPEGSIQRKC